MTDKPPEQPHRTTPDSSTLKLRYGDCAADYAEIREETAKDLGDHERAEQWQKVEQELRSIDAP